MTAQSQSELFMRLTRWNVNIRNVVIKRKEERTAPLPGKAILSPRAHVPVKRKINHRRSAYAKRDSTTRYIP